MKVSLEDKVLSAKKTSPWGISIGRFIGFIAVVAYVFWVDLPLHVSLRQVLRDLVLMGFFGTLTGICLGFLLQLVYETIRDLHEQKGP